MSGIDEVIKRSRARGGFTKKGAFTLSSDKARQKVSEFALPNPFYYCLELVQSAVALRATYMDITTDSASFILSIANASYSRREIEHLFDYLFSTEHDDRSRALRQLAVGIAASLALTKSRVVIESGDGTLEGSTRCEISGLKVDAEIGTPKKPVDGTFVKVTHAPEKGGDDEHSEERLVILNHCRFISTPLMLNNDTPFGCGFSRALKFSGYQNLSVEFDEGDLYGGLALAEASTTASGGLIIVSDGVEIADFPPPATFSPRRERDDAGQMDNWDNPVGVKETLRLRVVGAVTYDRLNKTASRYGVVKDDRSKELLERLKPYVHQLLVRADARCEDHLDYLIDSPAPPCSVLAPYRFEIQKRPFAMDASFTIVQSADAAQEMKVYLVKKDTEGVEKLIQYFRYEFPIPTVGRVIFSGDFVDALVLLRKGDAGFDVHQTVVVTPDIRNLVRHAVNAERPALDHYLEAQWETFQKKHLGRHLESQWTEVENMRKLSNARKRLLKALTNRAEAPPLTEIQAREELINALAGRVESAPRVSERVIVVRENEPAGPEVLPTPKDVPPLNAVEDANAASAAPKSRRKHRTMPTPEEIRQQLQRVSAREKHGREDVLSGLVLRILGYDGNNKEFLERFNRKIIWKDAQDTPFAAWVNNADAEKPEGALFINRSHRLIARMLQRCEENPMEVYAMVLLVADALRRQTLKSRDTRWWPSNFSSVCRSVLRVV